MIPNMASDYWMVGSDHDLILPDATPYPVTSHGIPISISPHVNGGRVDLVVHLVMSNDRQLVGPSTVPAASSIVIDGTLQEELGGDSQLRTQPISYKAELQPLATNFPTRNQYTPPYTPSGSHTDSTTFPLGEAAPLESEVEVVRPAPTGNVHDSCGGLPNDTAPPRQIDTSHTKEAKDVNPASDSQPNGWDANQRRVDASPSVHGSRLTTRSPARSLTRGDSPAKPCHDYSRHSQHRKVEYTSYRHSGDHQSHYSRDRYPMRSLSLDRAASKRGRSPSPKSLVDDHDHEQIANCLDHDVSTTRINRARSQSSSSISGIESRRESLSRSPPRDVTSAQVNPQRGYTPPRMITHPQSQWTRPPSPVNTVHHNEGSATRAGDRGSLASRLDIPWTQKKASTPTTPQSGAEGAITHPSPTYRFGKTRSEDYGMGGRPPKRRLQDRIDGNQTGMFSSKGALRCPYSHRVNGANDCHHKDQPHPGYTADEWRNVMEFVKKFGYAPPHLTKGSCVYHPDYKPPESSQPRNHPLNPFSVPPAAQGTDRYIPPPTPPVPQQPPMAIPYPQAAPIPASIPMQPFLSGPPLHTYPPRPAHMGASHVNSFDNSGDFPGRYIIKKRRIGQQGQFRPSAVEYSSQQVQPDQWPHHSVPPPNWNQQPPSNQAPLSIARPGYPRQAHRPNAFHNQQGQPPLPPPNRRKRTYDQG